MTIVPLAKVTVFGLSDEKGSILEGLQKLGCLHLIPLESEEQTIDFAPTQPADQARQALRYLMDVRQRRYQMKVDPSFHLDDVVEQALANQKQKREAEDRILSLRNHLDELAPWGEFTLPNLEDLAGYRLWFYRVPHPKVQSFRDGLQALGLPWKWIYESPRHEYYVIISPDEPNQSLLPVPRSHVGSESLQDLRYRLDQAHVELDDIEAEHVALSRWIFLLSKHLARADDLTSLAQAGKQTRHDDNVLQVQGWMPREDLQRLETFTRQNGIAFLAESPNSDDTPPTLMTNSEVLAGGEDLVTFYETPGYRDWDPSNVVFFSFALFFAMILSDAGYALVLAVLVAILWKGMGRSASGRHFRIVCCIGLLFAVIYGVLAGGYFGMELPASSPLAALKVLDVNNYEKMMKIAIVVGCLHLILANGVVAVRGSTIAAKAKPIGWIAIILSGLTIYLTAGSATGLHLGLGLGCGGLLTILVLSSERRLDSLGSVVLRLFDGLSSLAGISKLFGDVMSYLRLFALGLASASLALTFNQLAGQVYASDVPLGVVIALLILILGHGINLVLCILSGFVHGLRLNYIEFFNWSLSEEGFPFEPFVKKEISS